MSSEGITLMDPIAPQRPYKVTVFLDRDTLKVLERKRGPAPRKRSKSEAAYLLILRGVEAERAAETVEPMSDADRRAGEDRRQAS